MNSHSLLTNSFDVAVAQRKDTRIAQARDLRRPYSDDRATIETDALDAWLTTNSLWWLILAPADRLTQQDLVEP